MVNSRSTEQLAWQRNPIFEFLASLSFDAKVARAYVYGAPWFNLWLVLLGANPACSALSRWPWRKFRAGAAACCRKSWTRRAHRENAIHPACRKLLTRLSN